MRVLLHELCICSDEGATVVGQAEHEEQSVKHGGNKDMLVLAKKVSRVLLLMGLESHGAYGMVMDDAVSPDQRALQQETQGDESSYSMWLGIAGIFASGGGYKWIQSLWRDHDNLGLQLAELDAYAGRVRTDSDSLQGVATQLRSDLNEMEVSQGMLSDTIDSTVYGLVGRGGFTRHSDLSPDERRHMYAQERGNWLQQDYGFSTLLECCSSIEQGH